MALPEMDETQRKKPLCYDPERDKFIYFDEIISGEEKIIPLDTLSNGDLKKLVIKRHQESPDYKVQAISGPPLSRDDVVKAIEQDQDFGVITVQAETAYLRDFLNQIQQNLKSNDALP